MFPDVHRPEESQTREGGGWDSSGASGHRPWRPSEPLRGTQQDGSLPRQQDGGHREKLSRWVLNKSLSVVPWEKLIDTSLCCYVKIFYFSRHVVNWLGSTEIRRRFTILSQVAWKFLFSFRCVLNKNGIICSISWVKNSIWRLVLSLWDWSFLIISNHNQRLKVTGFEI